MNVLSLCDRTGQFVRPWADAGFQCYCVDLQHEAVTREGNITYLPYDVLKLTHNGQSLCNWLPWSFVAAWPCCTNLSGSGARWWQDKGLSSLVEAMALVDACRLIAEQSGAPYLIEIPVGALSSHWRKPDHLFHPYEFGGYDGGSNDGYTKKTCLWTGNGFRMPTKMPIELAEDHNRIHMMPPGPERANARSVTPAGFARAVFEEHGMAALVESFG